MAIDRRCHGVLLAFVMLVCSAVARAEWFSDQREIMGTRVAVELWSEDAAQARAALDAVMAEMERIDRTMSPWIESSELARINREAGAEAVPLSDEMYALIETSLRYSKLSDGAFDISFASVGYLYDYRRHVEPDERALRRHIDAVDYRAIELDSRARTIRFRKPGMRIDLGGIAKGYACDRGVEILRWRGIRHAIVTAGGDSVILGDRHGRPWMVGIRDPRAANPDKVVISLPLSDVALSTSGDYERYFLDGKRRVHHILDPKTGRSASAVRSVSILAPRGIDSDALSTAVFVLGVERGMALVNRVEGVDAIVIDNRGAIFYSDGLMRPQ
jgi:thiamine biosynthesis lipoprotein